MKKTIVLTLIVLLVSGFTAQARGDGDKCISYSPVHLNAREMAAVKKYADGLNFDPAQNMVLRKITEWQYHIDTVGVTYHYIQDTHRYALALLNLRDDALVKRASDAILAGIAQQDANPESRTFGVWPYYKEEPLATKRTPADFNMADFNAVVLLDIYMNHQDRLPAATVAKIKEALIRAARCIQKRNQGPDYTNIALMGTYVTYMVSHLFGVTDMQTYAFLRLKRFYDYTKEKGGFTEYNSSNYTITALNEITRMRQHIIEPRARKMVDELNDIVWGIIARHFYKPSGQWVGAQSRSYSTFLKQDAFYSLLYRASGGNVNFGKKDDDAYEILLRPQMPAHYYAMFNAPKYPRTEYDVFEPAEPKVTGEAYMTPSYALSTANRSCLWNQRRPFTAYWGAASSPRYLQVQFLHDGYDFSSAAIFSAQRKNAVLSGIDLFLYGGDKHLGLNPLKTGIFKAGDLRIRFRLGGTSAIPSLSLPKDPSAEFSFVLDGFTFSIRMFKASLDGQAGYWQTGGDGKDSWIDYVIYAGAQKEFDLTRIHEAIWAFTFAMAKPGEKMHASAPVSSASDNMFNAKWEGLTISVPTNLLPRGPFPPHL